MTVYTGRAPRGHTYDPCPGCGGGPTSYMGRPKDRVCDVCREALDKWAAYKANASAKADERVYVTQERDYGFPHISHEVETRDAQGHRLGYGIRSPLHALHMLLSSPLAEPTDWQEIKARGDEAYTYRPSRDSGYGSGFATYRRFPVAVAEVLRELHAGIMDSMAHAHAQGANAGRNLLLSLASGRITNDQFNESAARLEGRKDDDA